MLINLNKIICFISNFLSVFIVTGYGDASSRPAQQSFKTPEGLSPPTFENIDLAEDVTSNSITVSFNKRSYLFSFIVIFFFAFAENLKTFFDIKVF